MIQSKVAGLEEFSEQPRPDDDGVEVKVRPTQVSNTGDEYSGEWSPTGKRHGFGKCMITATSCFYEGYWKEDKPHGRGRLIMEDKTVIEGTFIDGLITRQWTDSDGNDYDGYCNLNGLAHGKC